MDGKKCSSSSNKKKKKKFKPTSFFLLINMDIWYLSSMWSWFTSKAKSLGNQVDLLIDDFYFLPFRHLNNRLPKRVLYPWRLLRDTSPGT